MFVAFPEYGEGNERFGKFDQLPGNPDQAVLELELLQQSRHPLQRFARTTASR